MAGHRGRWLETIRALRSCKMAPTLIHLPNGQTLTVSPVFAGLFFKSNDLNVHQSVFPPGWTIIIESEDELEPDSESDDEANLYRRKKSHVHRYRTPTLHSDNLFISSISNPSNTDFKPATSPTRQIAMMLWATLWWYFHQVLLACATEGGRLIAKASPHQVRNSQQVSRQTYRRLAGLRATGASISREKEYSRANSSSQNWSEWGLSARRSLV